MPILQEKQTKGDMQMKYLAIVFIFVSGVAAWGFYSKHKESCKSCSPAKILATVELTDSQNPPIACKLTNLEQVELKETFWHQVLSSIEEVKELDMGYAVRFPNEPGLMEKLSEFVELESQCCAFLTFDLRADPNNHAIWLKMTGADGTKKFLKSMLLEGSPTLSL